MASRESVVNLALGHLGEERTESLNDATLRPAARKVLGFLENARDLVLIAQDWLDARAYLTLQPAAEAGNWRWPGLYWLPPEVLMVRDVVGCEAWERGTHLEPVSGTERVVVRTASSGAEIQVVATRRIDWPVIPVYLEQPMGYILASLACDPVNGATDKAERLRKLGEESIALALGKDGVQTREQTVLVPDRFAALRRSAG